MTAVVVTPVVVLVLVTGLWWAMPALVKPTLPFGVRVPAEHTTEPVIAEQRRRYRMLVLLTGAVVIGAALAIGLTGHPALLPLLILATLAVHWLYYYTAHRRIRAAKRAGNWFEGHRQVLVAETGLRTDPPRFPWLWTLPAVLVVVATAVVQVLTYPHLPHRIAVHFNAAGHADRWADRSPATLVATTVAQVAVTALIIGLALLANRAPARLDAEDPEGGARRHRRYVLAMTRSLLVLATLVDLSIGGTAFPQLRGARLSTPLQLAVLLPPLVGVVVVLAVVIRYGQSGTRLAANAPARRSTVTSRDDDNLWRGGVIYVNREDRALFVPKRFGVGWTLNLGNPVSWVLLLVVLALAVAPGLYTALVR